MPQEVFLIGGSFIIALVGAVGVIVPFLPGVPLAWLGYFLFGYATDFREVGSTSVIVFFILTVCTFLLDFLAPILGAEKRKASWFGIFGSFLGLILGVVLLGPLGVILGPFVGAFLGEVLHGRNSEQAIESAKGALIGFFIGSLIKLGLVLVMIGFMIGALF